MVSVLSAADTRLQRVTTLMGLVPRQGWEELSAQLAGGDRWFLHGAGRSGLLAQMTAMRLMQTGIRCHCVGATTTPAIGAGDWLLTISRSGDTPAAVAVARKAQAIGASVAAITANSDSELASLATITAIIPAERAATIAADVSDQLLLTVLDAVCETLPGADHNMTDRHANLE